MAAEIEEALKISGKKSFAGIPEATFVVNILNHIWKVRELKGNSFFRKM